MINRQLLGYTTAPSTVRVDAWRVRLFCQAIGETDAVYWDPALASAAGHPACPLPPTYLKALESEHCNSATLLQMLGVPVRQVLHVEQSIEHLLPVHVGDALEIHRVIKDSYVKRAGERCFVLLETHYRLHGRAACLALQTLMIRPPRPQAT